MGKIPMCLLSRQLFVAIVYPEGPQGSRMKGNRRVLLDPGRHRQRAWHLYIQGGGQLTSLKTKVVSTLVRSQARERTTEFRRELLYLGLATATRHMQFVVIKHGGTVTQLLHYSQPDGLLGDSAEL